MSLHNTCMASCISPLLHRSAFVLELSRPESGKGLCMYVWLKCKKIVTSPYFSHRKYRAVMGFFVWLQGILQLLCLVWWKMWCHMLGSIPVLPEWPCSLPLTYCVFVWSADWSELSVVTLPSPLYWLDITTAWIPWTSLCPMMTPLSPLPLGLSCKARYVQITDPEPHEPRPLNTWNWNIISLKLAHNSLGIFLDWFLIVPQV